MDLDDDLKKYLKEVEGRLSKEMPRVLREIEVYENKLASGTLTKEPVPGPQFHE